MTGNGHSVVMHVTSQTRFSRWFSNVCQDLHQCLVLDIVYAYTFMPATAGKDTNQEDYVIGLKPEEVLASNWPAVQVHRTAKSRTTMCRRFLQSV